MGGQRCGLLGRFQYVRQRDAVPSWHVEATAGSHSIVIVGSLFMHVTITMHACTLRQTSPEL